MLSNSISKTVVILFQSFRKKSLEAIISEAKRISSEAKRQQIKRKQAKVCN